MLVADGVQEITPLGQNVNAYGVDFGDRNAFAKLLRRCGEVPVRSERFHLAPSQGLHRRGDRGHGGDAERDAVAAHAAAVRVGHGAAGDAPVVPQRALPGDHRPGPPAMPEAAITTDIIVGFRARPRPTSRARWTWSVRPVSPAPSPSSTRSGQERRPPPCRPGAEGRGAGALRAAGHAGGGDRLAGEPGPGRPHGRGHVAAGEGQGRRDRPACPVGPGTTAWRT